MAKISEHFSRNELACKCGCGQDTVDVALLPVLERVRDHFDSPTSVTSGNRCTEYNKRVGGAKNSQHLIGKAADIKVKGVNPVDVYNYLDASHSGGLGSYPGFTHVDSRDQRARWSG